MTSLSKIREALIQYSDWSLPIKLVVSGLIGVIGGSGFVGLISEYAAYSYAVYYQIRPPVEGVPYLGVSITLISALFMVIGTVAFVTVYVVGKLMLAYITQTFSQFRLMMTYVMRLVKNEELRNSLREIVFIDVDAQLNVIRKMKKKKLFAILLMGNLLLSTAILIYQSLAERPGLETALVITGVTLCVNVVLLLVVWPGLVRYYASIATVIFLIVVPWLLFTPSIYAGCLRILGYGGGMPVVLNVNATGADSTLSHSGYLMLRTSQSMIVYSVEDSSAIEIPVGQVRSIKSKLDVGGGYMLPKE